MEPVIVNETKMLKTEPLYIISRGFPSFDVTYR